MTKQLTDKELIQGCCRNKRQYQEALYRKFCPQMIQLGYRYTKDQELLISWINNGFLKVFNNIKQLKNQQNASLGGWVRTIVYRSIIDGIRKEKKYWNTIFFNDDYRLNGKITLPTSLLQFEDLKRVVDSIEGKSKEVFDLFVFDGLTHEEIAQKLDISEGTSKWHLHNARKEIQQKISNSNDSY